MLRRSVSTCEQLADCSILARLLYTWGLAHTSDWGVLAMSPRRLKAQVLPMSDEAPAEIGEAAEELVAAGLWVRFEVDGEPFAHYPTFDKYQNVSKRTSAQRDGVPLPPNVPGTSANFQEVTGSQQAQGPKPHRAKKTEAQNDTETGKFPEIPGKVGPREEKRREEKSREHTPPPPSSPDPDALPEPPATAVGVCDSEELDGATTEATPASTTEPTAPTPLPRIPEQAVNAALDLAIEGAYPQAREKKRRALAHTFRSMLTQPGCRITEEQLAECMEADPPLAGGTPQQYMTHAQGMIRAAAAGGNGDGGGEEGRVVPVVAPMTQRDEALQDARVQFSRRKSWEMTEWVIGEKWGKDTAADVVGELKAAEERRQAVIDGFRRANEELQPEPAATEAE
jgi:hypothetical protein